MRSAHHQNNEDSYRVSVLAHPRARARRLGRLARSLSGGALALGLMGCQGANLNPLEWKSFIDPGELGRYKTDPLLLKIVDHVDEHIEEPNTEFVTATEVTQDELTNNVSDYVVSKNDLLTIEISDRVRLKPLNSPR